MATISPSTPAIVELQTATPAASLRKELGFTDLVLASILLVVVPDFFGSAAKAGPAHVALWLLAIALFFLPQALVVSFLNQRLPMEGGLYEWARHAFGDAIGFLVALNLWMYVVLYVASIGLVTTNYAAYAVGLDTEAVAAHRGILIATSVAIIGGLMLVAHLGLGIGKWVANVGSALTVLIIVLLATLPFVHPGGQVVNGYHPLGLVMPSLTLFSFSVFSKMSFGALCGFEYAAIFAGESRDPRRHLTRAIWIAAPLIALLYIFGTSAILAYVSPDNIDVIGPIPQALRVALGGTRLGEMIVPIAILFLLTNYLSSFSLNFAANTRLPMCAGWDHLLPQWFTRLHPRYRTPVNSILFLGGITLAGSIAVLAGVGAQEAFELLLIWAFTFYAIAYLALFAIPILAGRGSSLRGPLWMKMLATFGFLMTLMYVVLSIFPIIPVTSQSAYSAKTVAVILLANLAGLVLYYKRPKPT